MREHRQIRLFFLLLAGFIVLAAPLLFFNSLLETAWKRTRDSAMGLLREQLLLESEQVKNRLTPEAYVKETIKSAHQKIMPEITQEIIRLSPDKDFTKDIFDERLTKKLLIALRQEKMEPLLIIVASPEFVNLHSWFAPELRKQCLEPDHLTFAIAYELLSISGKLYKQYYQKPWSKMHREEHLKKLAGFGFENASELNFSYLSRFGISEQPHDTVTEQFTDYFGKQSLFYYGYNCLSNKGLHGAYKICVLQSAIKPGEIVKQALQKESDETETRLVELPTNRSGFVESKHGLELYDRVPTKFWNHYFFHQRRQARKHNLDNDRYYLCLSATLPAELIDMQKTREMFRIASGCMLLGYLMSAVHLWLFGFYLPLCIRKKLLLLLGIIIFIPVSGTGIMAMLSLKGSDRVIENHLLEKTRELVNDFVSRDEENDQRLQLGLLELKREIENYRGKKVQPRAMLGRKEQNRTWLREMTGNHSYLGQDGIILHVSNNLEQTHQASHKLLDIILIKYLNNLGLLKKSNANFLSNTLALGLSEEYITPEREAERLPNEGTLQPDISHTLDTSRSMVIVARNQQGHYYFAYPRPSDGSIYTHAYLGIFSKSMNKWFYKSDAYCDIELGARLRRHYKLEIFAWPPSTLLDTEMLESFHHIMRVKDSGSRIIHNSDGAKTNAWSHRHNKAALFSAIGKTRSKNIGAFAVSMLFPVLATYTILLVMVLSLLFAEFMIKPVNIFAEGIHRLNQEEYGVTIKRFSGDEFSLVTSAFNKMSAALRQREMIKRLVSEKLIKQVESSEKTDLTRTEEVRVSVVASDIRGFTSISEKFTPSEVVDLLNTYFTAMEKAILENNGVIDKYIGDAIQAVFYDQPELASPAVRACRAGVAMRHQLQILNQQRVTAGLFPLENGIGIATGQAVSGSIGSETGRKDFTIIGKITEQAAQLEAKTANTDSKILVCNNTRKEVADLFHFSGHNDESWELSNAS